MIVPIGADSILSVMNTQTFSLIYSQLGCNLYKIMRHKSMIKPLRTIWILIFLLFAQKGYSQSAGTVNTIGGWIEVTPLGNAKYQVDCQLLTTVSGALSSAKNHQQRVMLDTSVELRIYDSAQNYVNIASKLLDGCFYTQKDTANQIL